MRCPWLETNHFSGVPGGEEGPGQGHPVDRLHRLGDADEQVGLLGQRHGERVLVVGGLVAVLLGRARRPAPAVGPARWTTPGRWPRRPPRPGGPPRPRRWRRSPTTTRSAPGRRRRPTPTAPATRSSRSRPRDAGGGRRRRGRRRTRRRRPGLLRRRRQRDRTSRLLTLMGLLEVGDHPAGEGGGVGQVGPARPQGLAGLVQDGRLAG